MVLRVVLAAACWGSFPPVTVAQPSDTPPAPVAAMSDPPAEPATAYPFNPNVWKIELTSYLWVPGMKGDVKIRGNSASVNESIGDTFEAVLDNFRLGLTGRIEARCDRLVLFGDLMLIRLADEDVNSALVGPGEFKFDQAFVEFGAAYAILDERFGPESDQRFRLEPLVGARLYYLRLALDFPLAGADVDDNQFWADGFAGVRCLVNLNRDFMVYARFDIGAGGSDLSWNAMVGGRLKVFKSGALLAGYRWLDVDYETGSGRSKFEFDVRMHGPFIGFSIFF